MKGMFKLIVLISIIVATNFVNAQRQIDAAASTVKFTITNLGFDVDGYIRGLNGKISFDPSNLSAAKFDVSLPIKGVRTGNSTRDAHLREEEFFNMAKYPTIRFVSTSVKKKGNSYTVTGNITLKGTTKKISFDFSQSGDTFSGTLNVNRNDYHVGGDGFFDTLGDNVKVVIKCKLK